MQHKCLNVQGVGQSRNNQQARIKSRTVAVDSATAVLCEAVNNIAAERGFTPPPVIELQLVNTQTTNERTNTFYNHDGVLIYCHYRTISVEVEPALKSF